MQARRENVARDETGVPFGLRGGLPSADLLGSRSDAGQIDGQIDREVGGKDDILGGGTLADAEVGGIDGFGFPFGFPKSEENDEPPQLEQLPKVLNPKP